MSEPVDEHGERHGHTGEDVHDREDPQHHLLHAFGLLVHVIVVQACVFPLFYKQMKSMRGMQAIQPKMMKIQNKYKGKNDPASKEAMQREMMKLYKDNNANPAGSCLPMLIQGPVAGAGGPARPCARPLAWLR